MIIDCHGHYTTAPTAHDTWRKAQTDAFKSGGDVDPAYPDISDDEIRETIELNQMRLLKERGADMTIFSPRASTMAHHIGNEAVSQAWTRRCNDLIARVVELFPRTFVGVCQLPQSPGVPIDHAIAELERCVTELGFIGCNLNPDPSGGHWTSRPLTDRVWYPFFEKMVELDVPAMVHVSGSCNDNFHATGAHYLNADTTAFMQFLEGDLFKDFPSLRFIIPHGGGAVPYHWGRFRGLADMLKRPPLSEHVMKNVFFDTCVYHQPGIDLLFEVIDIDNILFGSEMVGAVRGIDPTTGNYFDDTKRYVDHLAISAQDKHKVYEANARRVYPRLDAILKGQGRWSPTGPPAGFGVLRQLWLQVLAGTVLGVVLGWAAPSWGVAMKPVGDAFIRLVRMMIAPIVFCTVVHGVASMNDMRRAGRTALKALIYFEIVTTMALILALTLVNLWGPGRGMGINPAALDTRAVAQYVAQAKHQTVVEYLTGIIPDTFFGAFTTGTVLQVLLIAVLTALALIRLGPAGKPVLHGIGAAAELFFRVIGIIMVFAPIGAFGAIAFTVGKFGAASLASLGSLIAEFYAVCAIFTVVVLGGIAAAFGINLLKLMGYLKDEIVVVAATTSTETVLPRLIQKLKAAGCEESVVGLVVPLGYSFNLDGTCLYLATTSVFLAQATGTTLSIGQQVSLLAVMLLTSKGAAGVAGAAFIVLAATLASTGAAPVGAIALVLGIHRILAEALTFVNLIGNSLATLVVARWEGALDRKMLDEALAPVPKLAAA